MVCPKPVFSVCPRCKKLVARDMACPCTFEAASEKTSIFDLGFASNADFNAWRMNASN